MNNSIPTPESSNRRGFTFVEVTVTVLIMGILGAIAAPRMVASMNRARLDSAAMRVRADINRLRQQAVATSTTLTATFTLKTNSYAMTGLADLNHAGPKYVVSLNSYPHNAQLTVVDFAKTNRLRFDRFGHPDNGGTVVVTAGGLNKTITVNAETGRAEIQ